MIKLIKQTKSQSKSGNKIPLKKDKQFPKDLLLHSDQTFKTIFNNAGDGIILVDIESKKFRAANKMLSRMTGYSSEEIINLGVKDIHPKESLPYVFGQFEKQAKGVMTLAVNIPVKRKDRSVFYADINSVQTTIHGKKYLLGIFRDITERKLAEEKLRFSEEFYRVINENSPLGISVRSNAGLLLSSNDAWKKIWGLSQRTANMYIRKKREELIFEEKEKFLVKWHTLVKKIYKNGGTLFIPELKIKSKRKNAAKWISNYFYGIKGENGKIERVVILTEDITDRKIAEEKLKDSESRLKILFEFAPNAIFLVDNKGFFVDSNKATEQLSGYSRKEFKGKKYFSILSKKDIPKATAVFKKTLSGKPAGPEELEIIRKDKTRAIVDTSTYPVKIEGQLFGLGIARDITERKKHERQIINSREQLRNLSSHLQTIREEERSTIARDVHDDLGQSLSALKMDLSWLEMDMYVNKDESLKKIQTMKNLVDKSIKFIQRVSAELSPSILYDFGLSSAIQWQLDEFSKRTGIKCSLTIEPEEIIVDEKLSIAIFRIFQESLTNIMRHANATRVDVRLNFIKNNLELFVKDNGVGIDEEKLKDPKSFGLIGMQERIYPWGGTVEIKGEKGKGTTVMVNVKC